MPPLAPEHLERLTLVAPDVARAAGYRLVVLFGSAARGAPHPEDLDLGILADGLVDTVAAANHFIEALHTQHVDIVDLRAAARPSQGKERHFLGRSCRKYGEMASLAETNPL